MTDLIDPSASRDCSKHPDGPKIRVRHAGTFVESVWCCLLCGETLYRAGPVQVAERDTQTIDSVGDVKSILGLPITEKAP